MCRSSVAFGSDILIMCLLQAKTLTTEAVGRLADFNRRTLDSIAAQIYFYYSWANENTGTLAAIRRYAPGLCPVCQRIFHLVGLCLA
jgi:hypothetical protein